MAPGTTLDGVTPVYPIKWAPAEDVTPAPPAQDVTPPAEPTPAPPDTPPKRRWSLVAKQAAVLGALGLVVLIVWAVGGFEGRERLNNAVEPGQPIDLGLFTLTPLAATAWDVTSTWDDSVEGTIIWIDAECQSNQSTPVSAYDYGGALFVGDPVDNRGADEQDLCFGTWDHSEFGSCRGTIYLNPLREPTRCQITAQYDTDLAPDRTEIGLRIWPLKTVEVTEISFWPGTADISYDAFLVRLPLAWET
jgi:hypothetical protein